MSNTLQEQSGRPQHKCPFCREAITDDYLEQHPFPEFPCPCCGVLVERPSPGHDDTTWLNKRRDERFSASLKVTYPNLKRFMIDYTKNVSRGGMFIRTKSVYETGLRIDLALHVPGLEGPVNIVGRVVHNRFATAGHEDAGIGIEFIDVDDKSREMVIAAVRQQMPMG